jgi:hypothetical protein
LVVIKQWGHRAMRAEVVFLAVAANARYCTVTVAVVRRHRAVFEEDWHQDVMPEDVCQATAMVSQDR